MTCPCFSGSLLTCPIHVADVTNGADFVHGAFVLDRPLTFKEIEEALRLGRAEADAAAPALFARPGWYR